MPHLSQRIFALCVCLRGVKSLLYIFGVVAPRLARVVATIHATFRFQLARESHVSPQDPSERPYEQFEGVRWHNLPPRQGTPHQRLVGAFGGARGIRLGLSDERKLFNLVVLALNTTMPTLEDVWNRLRAQWKWLGVRVLGNAQRHSICHFLQLGLARVIAKEEVFKDEATLEPPIFIDGIDATIAYVVVAQVFDLNIFRFHCLSLFTNYTPFQGWS